MEWAFFMPGRPQLAPGWPFFLMHRQNASKSAASGAKRLAKNIKCALPMAKTDHYSSEHSYT
jgi:hypothetical protein